MVEKPEGKILSKEDFIKKVQEKREEKIKEEIDRKKREFKRNEYEYISYMIYKKEKRRRRSKR